MYILAKRHRFNEKTKIYKNKKRGEKNDKKFKNLRRFQKSI